jgi:hypothetical protein
MEQLNEFGGDILILDWNKLSKNDINERIDWLRRSLDAGEDWGYCEELLTCVLKNQAAATLYKLRWFENGSQKIIDKPTMMDTTRQSTLFGDE